MELKTNVTAVDGKPELIITRVFELPVELLFQAYTEPNIVAQWMGTKVLKLENHNHGGYQFETSDERGNVVFRANGVIHKVEPNRNITRTFEMENTAFDVQMEFLDFESLTPESSKLTMQIVYRSIALRDEMLKLPFAQGINMAHNRLQTVSENLNNSNHLS